MTPRSGIGKGTLTLLSIVLGSLLAYGVGSEQSASSRARFETAQCISAEHAVRGDFLLFELYQMDDSIVERFIYVAQNNGYGSLFVIPYEGATGRYVPVESLHRFGIGLAPRDRYSEAAAVWREQQPIDIEVPPSEPVSTE